MISIAIVDSGPLVAAANKADPDHPACLTALQSPGLRLVIPALCVAEVSYLIQQRRGAAAEARFLRGLESFDVHAPAAEDWPRIADLIEEELATSGVAVVIQAEHSCMAIRGIRKSGSLTVTSALRGIFKTNLSTRSEVMSLINQKHS